MTALVAKADISGTPSRATANAGFGNLWEFVDERFATGDGTAAEKAATRNALEATRTISPIDWSKASNALTIIVKPNATEFRSATLNSGAVAMIANAGDISLTIPSGATLGSSNAVLTRLAVLEINNAGTKEVAVVNLLGGVNLDERGVISTTALSTGSDSASVIYSTTARSNVPYRIVGFIEYTQATAGTYATDPSLVDGSPGPLARWMAGYGQTRQNMGGSRALATPYTNNTGRTIQVSVTINAGALSNVLLLLNGSTVFQLNVDTQYPAGFNFAVAPGETYQVNASISILHWWELR